MVAHIDRAGSVVFLCGGGCRDSVDVLRALSDRLKAPLIHTVKGKDLMPYDDPHWLGGIGMIGTRPAYEAAMRCDLLVMVGTDYPYSNFLPHRGALIQIDERPEVLGRRAPALLGVVGSARPTLERVLQRARPKADDSFWQKVIRQRTKWDERLNEQADLARNPEQIYPQAVARMVGDLARPDAVFVLDTGLNTLWSGNWIRQRGTQRIIGSFNNAAVGTALGQANGIQALDRARQVIALCGDGGFNMLMCEFLTAVQHRLPVKVVIFNNSAFGLITFEAENAGLPPFHKGIGFPNPDYAMLARACGGEGFTAKRPDVLSTAISKAFAANGPAIVNAVVPADELPNVPHLELGMVRHVAVAKLKEAMLAVKGA
jgi:thiamine pyrophosphate-dependent acetolactate synthase large subunit-like protein